MNEKMLMEQITQLEQYVTQCGQLDVAQRQEIEYLREENSRLDRLWQETAQLKREREATHWVGNTTLKVRKLPANLIATEPAPPPPMLFVTVTDGIVTEDGSLQSADMWMVSYACLALLSPELQAQVRAELKALVQPTGDHVVAEKP